ncbi:MAG: hypothetical protein K2Z81_18155, partial [Cyanobacteria bacterium]|nr:hypothetical protein [Cyanobacteriota bacterium]
MSSDADPIVVAPVVSDKPSRMVVLEPYQRVLKQLKDVPVLSAAMGTLHTIAIFAISTYFSPRELLTIDSLAEIACVDDERPTFQECLIQSKLDLRRFFRAALKIRSPLFIVLPGIFVLWLTFLNGISSLMLRSPHQFALWSHFYGDMSKEFEDERWIRDFTLDARPLFLTWFCLCPPLMILMMTINAFQTVVRSIFPTANRNVIAGGADCIRFRQRVDRDNENGIVSFFFSPWFAPVVMVPFLLGIPGIISLYLYFQLGIDPLLGYPSRDPQFQSAFVIIGLYLFSLGSCLSVLFFRSYFTFAWNFVSTEFDIEIYPDMIKRLPLKGWFLDFLSMGARQEPLQINWQDLESVQFSTCKLEAENPQIEHPALLFLSKIASFYESVALKLEMHNDVLELTSKSGRVISVRLWELSAQEKRQLFEALRRYAPCVYLNEKVQQALTGTTVMREPK